MFRHKTFGSITDFLFRMARSEGPLRGVNLFVGTSFIMIALYLK